MALARGLFTGSTAHARTRPRRHALRYRVYYLCFALSEMQQIKNRFLSLNRFNLFSFYEADHGRDGVGMQEWIAQVKRAHNLSAADGEVVLLTLPRVLGYVFNPVSFWFLLDRDGGLRAMLAEVNNTFGDRHSYLLHHDDQRVIAANDRLPTRKVFHVSPFLDVAGRYEFRVDYSAEKIDLAINHYDEDGLLLATSLTGTRGTLDSHAMLRCFFRFPLMTFMVIGLIHYHALRLVLKGIRYRRRPLPPLEEVTR
ncbi:MAG: DUF1365 domain-containing protein [Rickettsiales bacterium]